MSMISFIKTALILGAFIIFTTSAHAASISSVGSGNWSSASTWSTGTVPGANDSVTINHTVTYNIASSKVSGVTVGSGGKLVFAPGQSVQLDTDKNVIVNGRLEMKPSAVTNIHTLKFVNVDETKFVGGGMDPIASDVGLWVMGAGKLDILGAAKTGWTRLTGGANSGANTITVQNATGWRVGDEIAIAPNESPSVGERSYKGFEDRTITAISGNTITLNAGLSHNHPVATFKGKSYTAEVINLTRNVIIRGTGNNTGSFQPSQNGRAHILIRSSVPQSIRYAALRNLGPRRSNTYFEEPGLTEGQLGRYPLHFHHSGDGSRGSLVEGVVVREAGNHQFVPHESHGVTLRDTVAYNSFEDSYWWDDAEHGNKTHDTVFDHAFAGRLLGDTGGRDYELTGFKLGGGKNNTIKNSVAVGSTGSDTASGFHWPGDANQAPDNVWIFDTGNISHNNRATGIFVWQNDFNEHIVKNVVLYNNEIGIFHGAYGNSYQYINVDVFGNSRFSLEHHAGASHNEDGPISPFRADGYDQAFENFRTGGQLYITNHKIGFETPTLFKDCSFTKITDNSRGQFPTKYDFVNCTKPNGQSIESSDFTYEKVEPGLVIRVQRPNGTAYKITHNGSSATVTTISAFYNTGSTPPPSSDPDVTVAFSANPSAILSGESSTLSWSSSGATSCSISYTQNGNDTTLVNNGATSGSVSVSPTQNTTYTLICSNASKSGSATQTVTVTLPNPTAVLSASPTTINSGQSSTLSWSSTNATGGCTIDNGVSTGGAQSGSVSVSPVQTTTYTVTCTQPGVSSGDVTKTATSDATVTVNNPSPVPTLTFTADPTVISSGQSSSLTWSSTDTTSCTASGAWSGTKSTSGSQSVSPTQSSQYLLSCTGAGGTVDKDVTVTVSEATPAPTVTISASPASIQSGQSSTLTWSSTDASSCTASGAWSGTKSTSGSQSVSPTQTSTFTLSCTGTGGTGSGSATVTVGSAPPPSAGLIHHWKLDEGAGTTATDSAGSVNGSLQGGLWTTGKLGNAVNFDGADDRASLGAMNITGSALTLSVWVKADSWRDDGRFISKANGESESSHWWMLSGHEGDRLLFRLKTGGTTHTLIAGNGDLPHNAWMHAAATYDGAMMHLYLNGTLVGSRTKSGTINTSSTVNAWIGGNPGSSSFFFDGIIDDVRIYNVALSASEIAALAAGTEPAPSALSAPTATLSASPTTVNPGQSSTLSWSSTNAASCTGDVFSTGNAVSGSVSVSPANTTTYTVTCTNSAGNATDSETVTVFVSTKFMAGDRVETTDNLNVRTTPSTSGTLLGAQPTGSWGTVVGGPTFANGFWWWEIDYDNAPDGWSVEDFLSKVTIPLPTVTLSANPSSILQGQSTTLTWSSTNASSCIGFGFSTGGAASGSVAVTPNESTTYTISCTGPGGTVTNQTMVSVTSAPALTATISANPSTIGAGDSSVVSWSSAGADSCTGTNFSTGGATAGSVTVSPTANTNYSVSCTGLGGTVSNAMTLSVITPEALPTLDFTGVTGTFSWAGNNITNCTATGGWSGGQAASGSFTFTALGNNAYTLTCTGPGGTVTRTLTITSAAQSSALASTKFTEGQMVMTTGSLNVRSSASLGGTKLGTQPQGAHGTVIGGPIEADGYWWWQIDYDNAPDGWSAENWLE